MKQLKKKKFIGRKPELSRLNRLLDEKKSRLVVIRGRRRIGKSRLASEFGSNKKFFKVSGLAPQPGINAQDQREHFADRLNQEYGIAKPNTENWSHCFQTLFQALPKGPVVLLFDEISWMAHDDASFLPKLKDFWDNHFSQHPQLILILCGSISSWIEKNILSSTGYFGRINTLITLKEFSLDESLQLLSENGFRGSTFEKFTALSITGGIPWYLELIHAGEPISQNINELCFREDGILFNEYERIFNDLFGRRSQIYADIIRTLADGSAEYKDISKTLSYSSGGPLSEYLDDLTLSGFVSKEKSWSFKTGLARKIIQYRLKDNFLRFYLKYVEPNKERIESGLFENQSITDLKGFNTMLGLQLENLVLGNRDLIHQELGLNKSDIVAEGPYLQRQTKGHSGCQIDLLIQTKFNTLYVCEIKFTQRQIGVGVIDEVSKKIKALTLPRGYSCIPILIHLGEVSEPLEDSEYFLKRIDFGQFFEEG